ncbi:hypothetical protein ACET3Z_012767 [Daucus carota]
MTTLSSAACEWFLMFLILIYGGFSHLLTKFAWYCELETPCLLCSRLDHVFGEGPGYYRILLCTNHREEISSTIYCQIHDKLCDLREMCEECFMSTAMQNRPSSGSYKIMMGRSRMDFERGGFQSPYNFLPLARECVCCNKPLKTKTKAQRLLQKTPVGLGASRANVRPPLPRMPGRSRLSYRDNLKKIRENMSDSATSPRSRTAEKMMSYAGYAELKFNSSPNSESESDFPYSDDDDGSSTSQYKFEPSDSFFAQLSSDYHARKGKPSSTPPPELTFPDDVTSSSNIVKGPRGVSAETLKSSLSRISSMNRLSDHMLPKVVPPKSNAAETPLEVLPDKASTTIATQADLIKETASSKDADTSDLSNTGLTNKGREVPSPLPAQEANSDSVKVDKTENLQPPVSNSSSPEGIRVIKKSASSDKFDFGYESVDISIVPEIQGEDIVDRLKRQIDYDKKILSSLHKELEEERNASEISASQAMAMITKLQEEKSVLRMESAQRLRIMEEQAEYDMEALNKADELLVEKEMLILELETELEYYRNNMDESILGNQTGETSKRKEGNKKLLYNEVAEIDADANSPSESRSVQSYEGGDKFTYDMSSFFDFVDEKKYITQCLKDLERKLHQLSANAASSGTLNGMHSADITDPKESTDEKESVEGNFTDREAKADHQDENIGIGATRSHGNPSTHDENTPSVEDRHHISEESHSDHQKRAEHGEQIDLGTLEHEISDLNERLEALEVDHEILEHSVNSLRGGKEGVQFLQEIAGQLQELRKVEFGEK